MRVLFTTQVGSGHWRPLAPFARALAAAGHEVAFATTPVGRAAIARHGFRCFPAGIDDWLAPPRPAAAPAPPAAAPPQAEEVWVNYFVGIRAAQAIPDLLAICRAWSPDLIVREMTEFGGCMVAERLGLPHATVQVGAFRPDLQRAIAGPLNSLRAAVGLPPDPDLAMLYRYLLLSPVPPRLQDPSRPLPPTAHAVRHVSFDREDPAGADLPAWVGNLPQRPTVCATLGTAYNRTPGLFPALLAGLRDEPINLILTLGPNLDPAEYGPQPPNVRIERYIPLSLLFPHCDLVVAHGGFGTVLTALGHGLPLVLFPIASDLPDNARRCAALGVARVLHPHRRAPGSILAGVRAVLRDPRYRRRAGRLQAEMHALPGPGHAVTLLERLAAEQRPILAGQDRPT